MQEALEAAEEHCVTVAFEPETGNVVDSAEKGRRLLDEMRSPRLKVIMDAAHLFDAKDPARRLSRPEETLDEAFELLGEDLLLAHVKDVKGSGERVAAGKGDLDYDLSLKHLGEAGYGGLLVMHGLAEEEVEGSLVFLRRKLAEVGIGNGWGGETLMPVFERDGLTFHYLDEADRSERPFVFQHGLGRDVYQPACVFSPPPGIRVLSLDCRGHGGRSP